MGNDTDVKDVDIIESGIEQGGESGLVTPLSGDDQLTVLENLAKNAERMIEAKRKIWAACIKITKPADWTVFSSNGKSKAELGHAGALRYASFLGISFTNWTMQKETGTDDKGFWYRFDYECDTIFAGRTIRVYGRAGSRDKFFGKDHGEFKELHDINEGDVKMAGRRNCMKEGVKVLMGLHHMDPAELEAAGLKLGDTGAYKFKGQEAAAEEAENVSVTVEDVTQKTGTTKAGKPWTLYTVKDGEGGVYTTFSKTLADAAKAAKESKKPATITYTKGERGNNLDSLNGVTGNGN